MALFKLETCCVRVKGEAAKDVLNSTNRGMGVNKGMGGGRVLCV
jgi:hypothetical protein